MKSPPGWLWPFTFLFLVFALLGRREPAPRSEPEERKAEFLEVRPLWPAKQVPRAARAGLQQERAAD